MPRPERGRDSPCMGRPRATMSGDIWAYSEFINFPGGRKAVRCWERERGDSNYGHTARAVVARGGVEREGTEEGGSH